jgi:hypothetical protein
MKQMFELSGEEMDLDTHAKLFTKDAATVKKHGECYWLEVPLPEPGLSDADALAVAQERLARMNGIALMFHEYHHPPRVKGITTEDPKTGQLLTRVWGGNASGRIIVTGSANAHAVQTSGDVEVPSGTEPSSTVGEDTLRVAHTNELLERALYLYGAAGYDWRGLHMVLDAIEEGNGGDKGLKKAKFANPYEKKIRLFTCTANNFNKLGLDARHARKDWDEPKEEMTVSEAQELFRNLLSVWVEEIKKAQAGH